MNPIPSWLKLGTACLWAAAGVAQASDSVATITMLDGPAWVIHAASKGSAPEGAHLDAEDIIETSPTTSLLRLEFDDGTILDIGPSSRVLVWPQWPLSPKGSGSGDASVAYVLQGWAKVAADKPPARNRSAVSSLALDVTGLTRDVVVRVQGANTEVFAESGDVTVVVRGKGSSAGPLKLPRGQFLARRGDTSPQVTPRPQPDFLGAVPRPFMDTLPARAAAFKGKRVTLNQVGPISYPDVEAWLNAEARIRSRFPTRWKSMTHDTVFRHHLTAQLAQHPEWGPVLSPDKPASRPAVATPSNASTQP
ncbi:MAG: hypothetical protein KGL57_08315 [Burkholderiales bacterium]|nr:hypothetical protein [Burkholderiales bacterium]